MLQSKYRGSDTLAEFRRVLLHIMKAKDLDEILAAPARLAIVATVATLPAQCGVRRWTFTALRRETGLADGNLHVQARKLTEAGYLHRQQVRQGNRMVTGFELSDRGRRALRVFVGRLRDALEGGSGFSDLSAERRTPKPSEDGSQVW